MKPEIWLRIEGLAISIAAMGMMIYSTHAIEIAPIWLWIVLFFIPDLSAAGYWLGAKAGSICYNLFHSYVTPIVVYFCLSWGLGGADMMGVVPQGVIGGEEIPGEWWRRAWLDALFWFWVFHIAIDRALGFGLKRETGFKDTHLGRLGRK